MAKVFQYGSNCDEQRLNSPERLRNAAVLVSRAQTVDNFEIAFDVWSSTNKCAAADLIRGGNKPAWGVLYEIAEDCIDGSPCDGGKTLAEIEGGKYEKQCIQVIVKGETKSAVTFLVKGVCTSERQANFFGICKAYRQRYAGAGIPEKYILDVLTTALESFAPSGQEHAAERTSIEELRDGLRWK